MANTLQQLSGQQSSNPFDFSDKIREFAMLKQYKSQLDAEKEQANSEAEQRIFENMLKMKKLQMDTTSLKLQALQGSLAYLKETDDVDGAKKMYASAGFDDKFSYDLSKKRMKMLSKTDDPNMPYVEFNGSLDNIILGIEDIQNGVKNGGDINKLIPDIMGSRDVTIAPARDPNLSLKIAETNARGKDKPKEKKPDRMLAKDLANAENALMGEDGKKEETATPRVNQYNSIADGDSYYRFNPGAGMAEKVKLPKAPDGKQITMKDVRSISEEEGISIEATIDEIYRRLGKRGYIEGMVDMVTKPMEQAMSGEK
jgi:hypothetical protein